MLEEGLIHYIWKVNETKIETVLTLSHHETHESVVEQIMTPTQKSIKCSKKQLDSAILPPKCAEHALSNLLMSP